MIQMSAVKKGREIFQQRQTADCSPADVLDQPAVGFCLRRDHHFSTGVFAVVEGQKKAAIGIEFHGGIQTKRKSTPAQTHQAAEYGKNVTGLAEAFEAPV